MELTPDNIRALRTDFYSDFAGAYSSAEIFGPRLASTITSGSRSNTYGWPTQLPSMRESSSSYALENKEWEQTIGVPRPDIRDDNLGIHRLFTQQAAIECARHPDELLITLLKHGHEIECFDGQPFFHTSHPVNPRDASFGVYQNYYASGKGLDSTNFLFARTEMRGFRGEQGKVVRARGTLLVVPPALESKAIELLVNERLSNGASNTTKGMADYLVIDELDGEDTTWYLLDTSKPIKPFIHQVRERVSFVLKNQLTDEVVLIDNEVRFYAQCSDNAGYTLPFLAMKLKG
jgi:phage major head subunit gpT-like protein